LLQDLYETLQDGKLWCANCSYHTESSIVASIVLGEKLPWDCLSSDSEDSSDDRGNIGTEVAPVEGLEANTELKQLKAGIIETVTCLLRLSMAVRNPAPHDQYMKSMNIDTSFYEEHDIKHVEEKFPEAESFLISRLGRAISRRRQYLKYREAHHKKLAYGIDKEAKDQEDSHTEAARQSTVASSLPSALKEVDHIDLTEDSGSESVASMASSVTSANDSAKLRPPPLPKESLDGNPFECPLCFMIVSIRGTRSWK